MSTPTGRDNGLPPAARYVALVDVDRDGRLREDRVAERVEVQAVALTEPADHDVVDDVPGHALRCLERTQG